MATRRDQRCGRLTDLRNRLFRSSTEDIAMKIKLDKAGDALYFRLRASSIIESEEVRPGVILDFDENDRVVGVEFLQVSERASKEDLAVMQFEQD